MSKYKVRKGDSWISIANNNNLNLNDLLYWNGIDPMSKENLPTINPGQELYTQDPYRLYPSFIQAEAPKDYINFGDKGKELIDKYALAVKQGNLSLDRVPEVYKTAVYQKMITNATDKAADTTFKVGLNAGAFMADPIGYGLSLASQKGLAYANDAISGRNEYGIQDLIDYTPIKGRDYAQRHPFKSALIDVASGVAGGTALRNLPNWISYVSQNGKGMIQNALRTTGLQRQTMMMPGNQTFGTVFQDGTKGLGKTGTVRASHIGGYQPNSGIKGLFRNQSSGNAIKWVSGNTGIPIVKTPAIPLVPVTGPISWMRSPEPPVKVPPQENKHIYEQQSFNRWQLPNPSGIIGQYQPGTGVFVITGHAPIGNNINDQALTQESIKVYNNDYAPRISTYTKGSIEGTPSNIYSGLGIIWGSDNPGNLIIK